VVIVLGEELGRFRDASKTLYKSLEAFTWSGKVERLGFDEVFMDVTDIVDFNEALLNPNDLTNSFFQLKRNDPTVGFSFDATRVAGHGYPDATDAQPPDSPTRRSRENLGLRLILGSHMAQHLRWSLEEQHGYTSTVGISTTKLCAKLVGNLHKPKGQTTLLPPYLTDGDIESNITTFIDPHDIGKIPGIGFRMAQKIRNHVLARAPDFEMGFNYGSAKETVTVRNVRLFDGMGPEVLEDILGGPGAERGLGGKAWGLINGVDDSEVQQAKKVPTQISIEDSYMQLDTMPRVLSELRVLATSLLRRMHIDLLEENDDPDSATTKRWIAVPKTVRISTRPRPPLNTDGTRHRSFSRISRSGPLPTFVFNLKEGFDATVEKLVQETLIPMFRKLHPYPSGWNLSLVNIGVTNMVETASEDRKGEGRDIGRMFRKQEEVLKEWRVEDRDIPPDLPVGAAKSTGFDFVPTDPSAGNEVDEIIKGSEEEMVPSQNTLVESIWEDAEDEDEDREKCRECGAIMPGYAMAAHERFHSLED
jgi:DNA polymerase iota